jgi:hypothetical protein
MAAFAVGALVLTLLAWFIPMVQPGGGAVYLSSLWSLWRTVPSKAMVFNSSGWNSFARAALIVGIFFLCFGCAAILLFLRGCPASSANPRIMKFTRVWVAPGLLFFIFVYLRFVNSGYLLVLAPPICAWMGLRASHWYRNSRLSGTLRLLIPGGCAAANTMVFLFAPFYCSYREVRRFEAELETIVRALPQIAAPRDTMIVGFDSHFLGYRHAGYYLPDYVVVQYPEVKLSSGMRVFAMRHRDTWLESRLPAPFIRNFILFPLPSGDSESSDYMATVRRRFAPGELHTILHGGYEFAVGRAADLGVLFPLSASGGVTMHVR